MIKQKTCIFVNEIANFGQMCNRKNGGYFSRNKLFKIPIFFQYYLLFFFCRVVLEGNVPSGVEGRNLWFPRKFVKLKPLNDAFLSTWKPNIKKKISFQCFKIQIFFQYYLLFFFCRVVLEGNVPSGVEGRNLWFPRKFVKLKPLNDAFLSTWKPNIKKKISFQCS